MPGPSSYPALTVWQPWATLIAEGLKPLEFRSWRPPERLIGQRIAIHAGSRPVRVKEISSLIYRLGRNDWRDTGLIDLPRSLTVLDRMFQAPRSLPLSSMLCIATLGEPVRDADLARRMDIPPPDDVGGGVHTNWGWPLSDIEVLRPFQPVRGAQGIWTWTRLAPASDARGAST